MNELWRLNATDITRGIAAGDFTAREVTEAALARLADVNPAINAVVGEMPDEALAAADAVDAARATGQALGPLAGVPVTVKVNVDQKGHANTNGVRIQKDLIATEDSPVITNLRKSGAVIVGRTNTPAFSLRWFCRNSLHGHTLNPRDKLLTPGGSSGGAGSATAAGIGAIGHGTDIAGSIRYPAYACGIHGLRPTLGRIPAINFSTPDRLLGAQIMAVSGPLARSIKDIRLGLEAMSTPDPRDGWYVPVPLDLGAVPKRAALCVNPEGLATDPAIEAALRESAKALEAAGWEVTETPMPPIREAARLDILLWMAEMRRTGGQAIRDEDDPGRQPCLPDAVRGRGPGRPTSTTCWTRYRRRLGLLREWQAFLTEYPVLLCPVSGELPFPDQLDVESDDAFRRCFEAQIIQIGLPFMGLPGLTVTTGAQGTTPVGIQIIGNRYREDVMLEAGTIVEAASTRPTVCDPR